MQRIVEQPAGEGVLLAGATRLGRVHYHLAVYQHFSEVESEPVPASLEVEGRITPIDAVDTGALFQARRDVTLQLGDGRAVEIRFADPNGAIRSTGRSLHLP